MPPKKSSSGVNKKFGGMGRYQREAEAEEKYDKFSECQVACEKRCFAEAVCPTCGQRQSLVPFSGVGRKQVAKKSSAPKSGNRAIVMGKKQRDITVSEMGRYRAMCADGTLSDRDKAELRRIATVVGATGLTSRTTKAQMCDAIRRAVP